jgi:hypothetical protein
MTVENGLCNYALCLSFPVHADDLAGQGNYWITVTRDGRCFTEAPLHAGNNTQQDLLFNDPLTRGNAPPGGLYFVDPGYNGGQWIFYILSPT